MPEEINSCLHIFLKKITLLQFLVLALNFAHLAYPKSINQCDINSCDINFCDTNFCEFSTNLQKLVSQKCFKIRDSQKLVSQKLMKMKNFRKS